VYQQNNMAGNTGLEEFRKRGVGQLSYLISGRREAVGSAIADPGQMIALAIKNGQKK